MGVSCRRRAPSPPAAVTPGCRHSRLPSPTVAVATCRPRPPGVALAAAARQPSRAAAGAVRRHPRLPSPPVAVTPSCRHPRLPSPSVAVTPGCRHPRVPFPHVSLVPAVAVDAAGRQPSRVAAGCAVTPGGRPPWWPSPPGSVAICFSHLCCRRCRRPQPAVVVAACCHPHLQLLRAVSWPSRCGVPYGVADVATAVSRAPLPAATAFPRVLACRA